MPQSSDVTRAYQEDIRSARDRLLLLATQDWSVVRQSDIDGSFAPWRTTMVAATQSAVRAALTATEKYLTEYLDEPFSIDAEKYMPTDVELARRFERAPITMKVAVGQRRSDDEVMTFGLNRALQVIRDVVTAIPAQALGDQIAANRRVVGWLRVTWGTCSFCAAKSNKSVSGSGNAMSRHPNCQCVSEPVTYRQLRRFDDSRSIEEARLSAGLSREFPGGPRWAEEYQAMRSNANRLSKRGQSAEAKKINDAADVSYKQMIQDQNQFYREVFQYRQPLTGTQYGKFAAEREAFQVNEVRMLRMNNELRMNPDRVPDEFSEMVRGIDAMIDESQVTEQITVYRGMTVTDKMIEDLSPRVGSKLDEIFKPGAEITDPAFMSADMEASVARGFAKQRGATPDTEVLFRIQLDKGQDAVAVGHGEVVLPRGTSLKVLRTEQRDGYLQVDVVAQPTALRPHAFPKQKEFDTKAPDWFEKNKPTTDDQKARAARGEAISTEETHARVLPSGKVQYSEERVRTVHDPFIDDLLKDGVAREDTRVTFMGGGAGSGKGSIQGMIDTRAGTVKVDPDAVKQVIPEFKSVGADTSEKAAGSFVHEESSQVAKEAMARSIDSGFDTVLDGTGNGSINGLATKVEKARDGGGERVVAEYVTIDTEEALARAAWRATNEFMPKDGNAAELAAWSAREPMKFTGPKSPDFGRGVADNIVRGTHESVSRVLPKAVDQGLFDEVRLWDNMTPLGEPPKLVMSQKDGVTTIHDRVKWESFLRKDPDYEANSWAAPRGTKFVDDVMPEPPATVPKLDFVKPPELDNLAINQARSEARQLEEAAGGGMAGSSTIARGSYEARQAGAPPASTKVWKSSEAEKIWEAANRQVADFREAERNFMSRVFEQQGEARPQQLYDDLRAASGGSSVETNKLLREIGTKDFAAGDTRANEQLRLVGLLDKELQAARVREPIELFRGVAVSSDQLPEFQVGRAFIDSGYQSAALTKQNALEYAGLRSSESLSEKVIYRIQLRGGESGANIEGDEILLPRNLEFKVVKVEKKSGLLGSDLEMQKAASSINASDEALALLKGTKFEPLVIPPKEWTEVTVRVVEKRDPAPLGPQPPPSAPAIITPESASRRAGAGSDVSIEEKLGTVEKPLDQRAELVTKMEIHASRYGTSGQKYKKMQQELDAFGSLS
jgi:hypothetical protein